MEGIFAKKLLGWYATHRRDLPWRDIGDPYKIWVSEIILQQTRVAQGLEYYQRFVEAFPNVEALAHASEDEVLRLWQGLGYYSRARNMHQAAQQVVAMGGFPASYDGMLQLKGVGNYTAAAICSFAFNQHYAVVDGNVFRVLSRYFAIEEPIDTSQGKKLFLGLAQEILPKRHEADYNQALMDFGATQCTPTAPECDRCVLSETCLAYAKGLVVKLPVKSRRTRITERFFVYVVVSTPEGFWLRQRKGQDIWKGLYEPPLLEFSHLATYEEVQNHPFVRALPAHGAWKLQCEKIKHVLTHRVIFATAYNVFYGGTVVPPKDFIAVKKENLASCAFPRLVERVLQTF